MSSTFSQQEVADSECFHHPEICLNVVMLGLTRQNGKLLGRSQMMISPLLPG